MRNKRKAELLEAALVLFAEEGYATTTIERIAKKAGASKGLLYNYFKGKEDILVQIVDELMEDVQEMFNFPDSQKVSDERIKQFISDSIDIVLRDTVRWKLFFSITIQPKVTPILMKSLMVKAKPVMVALTKYFKGKGYKNPEEMMRYCSAILDGVQMHVMLDPKGFPVELAKRMIYKQFIAKA